MDMSLKGRFLYRISLFCMGQKEFLKIKRTGSFLKNKTLIKMSFPTFACISCDLFFILNGKITFI